MDNVVHSVNVSTVSTSRPKETKPAKDVGKIQRNFTLPCATGIKELASSTRVCTLCVP